MNAEERFEFNQIRAITDGPMHKGNRAILEILDRNPALLEEVPLLDDLRTHLVFWLNKYEKVFTPTPEMCVCFAGVEDGIPFPRAVRREIAAWLDRTSPAAEGNAG